jgi:hypothetical protein
MSKYEDINFGNENELEIYKILKNKFPELKKTYKYNVFDFYYDNLFIELKSRRCK